MAEEDKKIEPVIFYYETGFDFTEDLGVILGRVPDEQTLTPVSGDGEYGAMLQYPPLSAAQERHLFRQMNCLKYQAFMADNHDERDDCLFEAGRVKKRIAEHTLRLVFAMSKQADGTVSPSRLSDGMVCLLRCVDRFDYRPPTQFSHYLCSALRRSHITELRHSAVEERHIGRQCVCRIDRLPATEQNECQDEWDEVIRRIERELDNQEDRSLMKKRLGLEDGRSWLYTELATEMKCSSENVRKRFNKCSLRVFGHLIDSNLLDF